MRNEHVTKDRALGRVALHKYSSFIGRFQDEAGQMTVELAFLIPVVIVSALIIINLGYFSSLCAKFDRVSQDMITSHGVAPPGEQSSASAKAQIEEKLKQAMGEAVQVEVSITDLDASKTDAIFTLNPTRVRVKCLMRYKPQPSSFSISGVDLNTPFELTHETDLVLDIGSSGLGVDSG